MRSYNVPHGTIDEYIELLLSWNKKINLVSMHDKNVLIERHILDSLQLLDYIAKDEVVFDLGSGAGFPGLMLSYGGVKNVHLVERNDKKASFLMVAAALSINNVIVYNRPIESLNVTCNIITARGLANLEHIFAYSRKIANEKTKFFLLKGKNVEDEIKNALNKWSFRYILHQSKTSLEGCILEVENLQLK